jgi:hypothetical protein
MTDEQKELHNAEKVIYSDRPDQWIRCSCKAEWRIPSGSEEFVQNEINETIKKHKAYAKRMETRPD